MCCGLYFKGKTEEALQVLQDGLDECVRWGEVDIQGLLMLEGAKLEAQRGKMDNSRAMLKVLKSKHTHTQQAHSKLGYIFFICLCNWVSADGLQW